MLLPTDINHRSFQVKLQIKDGKTLILCCRWAQVLARVYNKPVGCAHFALFIGRPQLRPLVDCHDGAEVWCIGLQTPRQSQSEIP